LTSSSIDLFRKTGGDRLPAPCAAIFHSHGKEVVKRIPGLKGTLWLMVSAMLRIFPQMDRSAAAGVVKAEEIR
jgi:hypothetical protein